MAGDLDFAKEEAAVGNRMLAEFGIAAGVRASLGHVSMRVPGEPDKFVVKGRGYRIDILSRMRPEDMVVCDLEGNWVDGPPGSLQCSEVKIHSCIYKLRPDLQSVTHVHPDYTVLMTVFQKTLVPMAQEGVNMVEKPLPLYPEAKVINSEAEGQAVAKLLGEGKAVLLFGHGAVTVGRDPSDSVISMVHLEHQARLNYLAMCAGGANHPFIPAEIAARVGQARPEAEPHLKARMDKGGARRPGNALWHYYKETLSADM